MRPCWWCLVLPSLALAASPDFRLERTPVQGGAELITVFGALSAENSVPALVPLVAVLRDTLGDSDPANDRLRDVWVLTSAPPNVLRRVAAALPFFYWSPELGKRADMRPVPVLDLGDTSRTVWTGLAAKIAQVAALDTNGMWLRSSTRRYRDNLADQRRVRLIEGLAVLSQVENVPEVETLLSDPDLLEIEARLTLAGQPLGGLVNASKLPDAYFNQRTRRQEARGHNWEMLRQLAEANGLYFEPLGLGEAETHALLYVAREDLGSSPAFDGKFLKIADPFRDPRVLTWKGIAVTAYFDAAGRRGPTPVAGGFSRELIPLALYGLGYPNVPLLLADFRATRATKHREMLRRAATDVMSGVLGISQWGNWPYFAGAWVYGFIEDRRGSAFNRGARLEAFSETRRWLALDSSLDPALRQDLQRRLEVLGVNPLQTNVFDETSIARSQYAALQRYAADPQGLPARVQRDREAERRAYEHNLGGRAGLQLLTAVTLGGYRHGESIPRHDSLEATLDRRRRADREVRFLESVLRSNLPARVADVERSLNRLAQSGLPERGAQVVDRLLRGTTDSNTRAAYRKALESPDASAGE